MIKPAKRFIFLCALLFPVTSLQGQDAPIKELLDWHRLPDLPDSIGVGGPCAGISNGALIVAGGAHFRDPFLQGGEKVWTDSIYVLTSSFSEWKSGFTLTHPTGYTVAAQWEDEVICAGGGDARKHFEEVIALYWDGESISQRSLPALPQPRAFASGAVVETTLYIAGGLETPDDSVANRNFWALNLADPGAQWQILEHVPGTPGTTLWRAHRTGHSISSAALHWNRTQPVQQHTSFSPMPIDITRHTDGSDCMIYRILWPRPPLLRSPWDPHTFWFWEAIPERM